MGKIFCLIGLHNWWIEGWPKGKHLRNLLRRGRVRYCIRCSRHEKYDGQEWRHHDGVMANGGQYLA